MNLSTIIGGVASFITRLFSGYSSPEFRLFSYMPQWPGCGAEREMGFLLKLSRSTATCKTESMPEGALYAHRCITSSQALRSYHSRLLLHQYHVHPESAKPIDHICVWLIDFAKPCSFRVTQVTGGEASYNDFDRWATIGEHHYEWLSFQLTGKSHPGNHCRNNHFLTIDKWLILFAKKDLLVGANVYRAFGRRYVLLEFQASSPSGVFTEELPTEVSAYQETAYAWIDEDTGRLAKGEIEVMAQTHTGDKLPATRLQQIFAGYEHDMRFDASTPFPELRNIH